VILVDDPSHWILASLQGLLLRVIGGEIAKALVAFVALGGGCCARRLRLHQQVVLLHAHFHVLGAAYVQVRAQGQLNTCLEFRVKGVEDLIVQLL